MLRTVGAVECLAFAAVVIPFRWMEPVHEWLGLGPMPEGAVLRYLIRGASFVYGVHGMLLLLLAWDVERFRPLVIFTGFCYFVSGPIFMVTGAAAGMPWFWFVGEGLSCLAVGMVVLGLAFAGEHGVRSRKWFRPTKRD